MKMLLIAKRYEISDEKELLGVSKEGLSAAHHKLQDRFISSLRNNNADLNIIATIPLGNYPTKCRKVFFKSKELFDGTIYLGFINLPFLKHLYRRRKFSNEIKRILSSSNEKYILLIYDLYLPFLQAALKYKNTNTKIIVIVPDLPGRLCIDYQANSIFVKKYRDIESNKIIKLINKVDGCILVTKYMAQALELTCPYIVIEGMADSNNCYLFHENRNNIINILYAGELTENVGLTDLIAAFEYINDDRFRLHICGKGNMESYIKKEESRDNRIKYHGYLDSTEMKKLEQYIDIYVNPRKNNCIFTRYSFPSKNIEYLATGKPVIAYALDGVPEEYYQHLVIPKDESVESLSKTIVRISSMSQKELSEKSKAQIDFIMKEKSIITQGKKIMDFLETI